MAITFLILAYLGQCFVPEFLEPTYWIVVPLRRLIKILQS